MTGRLFPRDLGRGIVMHPLTTADAEAAFAIVDAERDRLRQWLPWVDQTTEPEVTRQVFEAGERADAAGEALHSALRLDGAFVGIVDLRVVPLHRSGEVGYWLAYAAVGKGVMTRAVAELFDIGFETLGLHRIQLQAATENTRSRAVAERLGMRYEGIRREAEALAQGFVDLAMYSTLAHEWPGAAAALARTSAKPAGRR